MRGVLKLRLFLSGKEARKRELKKVIFQPTDKTFNIENLKWMLQIKGSLQIVNEENLIFRIKNSV